ncbi:MAG: hypothetical protein BGO76_04630 [Caedibacter sp. 38-128]|nr:hypothetical protein [Holosporales bacterium]OJX04348.1 MAG: hypothetical protein BGO76_04630 [Caedibacter sp. 38-128]
MCIGSRRSQVYVSGTPVERRGWIPAFAGMTNNGTGRKLSTVCDKHVVEKRKESVAKEMKIDKTMNKDKKIIGSKNDKKTSTNKKFKKQKFASSDLKQSLSQSIIKKRVITINGKLFCTYGKNMIESSCSGKFK